jgi:tRNA(Ile)-lysidine synthase
VYLDADAVRLPLAVRTRRQGDRFVPLGMGGHKTLHRLFIDARVPAAERDLVPVVADQEGILWVAGLAIAHRARVTAATERLLRLSWTPAGEAGGSGAGDEEES